MSECKQASEIRTAREIDASVNTPVKGSVPAAGNGKKYVVLAAEACDGMAKALITAAPDTLTYYVSKWKKFPDGTDNITLGGFNADDKLNPHADGDCVSGEDVLFLASFDSNATAYSQLHALTFLAESCYLNSLTIVLPFLPTATMERSLKPGRIATCNTTARILSQLPPTGGRRTRVMIYDIHAPPTQFFFTGSCAATLHTACPLIADRIRSMDNSERIDCIAFPDEGACKRFGRFFKQAFGKSNIELVTCCKKRNVGEQDRVVEIFDGNPEGKNVLIMDDLIQTGGTLYDCAVKLKEAKAKSVNGFVVHAVFPKESWRRFLKDGDRGAAFSKFWLTNSNPSVCDKIPTDDAFEILDLMPQLVRDLGNLVGATSFGS